MTLVLLRFRGAPAQMTIDIAKIASRAAPCLFYLQILTHLPLNTDASVPFSRLFFCFDLHQSQFAKTGMSVASLLEI
jgi:hypothetical protein